MKPKLLLATNNKHKVEEYSQILSVLPITITYPAAEGITLDPEETGKTFEENAIIKAKAFAEVTDCLVLTDDSGIEVDALNGEPGVYSARYGNTASDDDVGRCHLVLEKLKNIPDEQRTGRFRCVVALATKAGVIATVHGTIEGFIAHEMKGNNGFGYDPIFYYPPFKRTLGQVSAEEKHSVSHRGRAARAALPLIEQFYANYK